MNKELAIVLRATGATQTARDVGKVDKSIQTLTGRAGTFATKLKTNVGGALTTFGGRLKGLATSVGSLLGVGGLLGVGKVFSDSIQKARDFGDTSFRLSKVIGTTVDEASRLVDALDYFGVTGDQQVTIASRFEKSIAGIAKTSKTAAAFTKQYGLQITDSKGHLLSYNEQLKVSADYFNNKNIPASKKAAALSKLYGKTWQDLIPVLATGRKGIEQAEKDAMSISQADLDAITKNKEATRKWTDAVGDLETRIGIDLLPTLTDMISTLTGFISSHGTEIRDFFKHAVETGKNFAGTALEVVKGIQGVWNSIPQPVRDLLVKGFVADRTVKFLFGFSITDAAKGLLGGVTEGLGGALVKAGIGKAFVQPVFVTNPGFGGGGGGGIPSGAAAAGGGILMTALTAATIVAVAGAIGGTIAVALGHDPAIGFGDTLGATGKVGKSFDRSATSNSAIRVLTDHQDTLRRDTMTRLASVRDKLEANRIAVQSGSTAIVAAIRNQRMQFALALNITGSRASVSRVSSGATLSRHPGGFAGSIRPTS